MRGTAIAFLVLASLAPARAQGVPAGGEMTFARVDAPNLCRNCDVVQANGGIGPDTLTKFNDFVAREKIGGKPFYFIIDSGGGKVSTGWALGRRLRAMQASVIAGKVAERPDGAIEIRPGACISMCNSVLAAGVERRISPGTVFGVHQFSPTSEGFRNLDNAVTVRDMRGQLKTVSEWLAYAREMSIDQRLVEAQLNVPFEKVDFIPHETLAEWRVVTAPASTLPKLLRNPRAATETVASQPQATPAPARPAAATTAALPIDRRWSPPRPSGEWRESILVSDADFLRVAVACAPQGRYGMQITLRGMPEARQKALAQQIIAAGGFDLVERPVDISQIAIGFGSSFWIRASLNPDQIGRIVASAGQFTFAPQSQAAATGKRDVLKVETTGFADNVAPMLAACSEKQELQKSAQQTR
ncbi:hypothetical protein [Terrarubrum flagellatum]|uniref:COG3904 family protein n=1 Tax=Terrirubrum flagellatum TaxID=2895980 RepID=UPI003144EAD9